MTHLAYVEQLLRSKSTDGLAEQQKINRAKALNLLHIYWTNGVFPANHDYPDERRPCFIDKDGNICAVGFLVEKTAGRKVAEAINEAHQYHYLLDMNEAVLSNWAEENGFTLEECATIQPTYGPAPETETLNYPIPKGYGIASGFVGGANLAITTINLSGRLGNSRGLAYAGLVTGATQIIIGVSNIKKDRQYGAINDNPYTLHSYKAQNNLSYFNIGMGTATMVTSAINLYIAKKMKSSNTALNLYSYPGLNNEMNLGLTLARKL